MESLCRQLAYNSKFQYLFMINMMLSKNNNMVHSILIVTTLVAASSVSGMFAIDTFVGLNAVWDRIVANCYGLMLYFRCSAVLSLLVNILLISIDGVRQKYNGRWNYVVWMSVALSLIGTVYAASIR